MLIAYFGPETFLPLTSVIAGIVGIALMLGKNTLRMVLWPVQRLLKRNAAARPSALTPHFPVNASALERRRARAGAGAVRQAKPPEEAGH